MIWNISSEIWYGLCPKRNGMDYLQKGSVKLVITPTRLVVNSLVKLFRV
jgi:hypothetical protein